MPTVTIKGLPQLAVALDKVGQQSQAGAVEGIFAALTEIANVWAGNVHVDKGHYRAAMQQPNAVKVRVSGRGAVGYVSVPYVKGLKKNEQPQLYALRDEYGDLARRANPAARNALDTVEPRIPNIVGKDIKSSVEGHGGKRSRQKRQIGI